MLVHRFYGNIRNKSRDGKARERYRICMNIVTDCHGGQVFGTKSYRGAQLDGLSQILINLLIKMVRCC